VGVTPKQNVGGCSASFGSLNELVALFVPTGNGVIWIENTDVTTANVTISGTAGSWVPAAGFALTFKGGWNGTFGSTVTNPATPSVLDNSLTITGWTGAITLSDILFSGVASGTALDVETAGNITLTRVDVGSEVTSNLSAGAILNNTSGAGNILISESEFSNNAGGNGLTASSKGTITLTNVNANDNGGSGAVLDNSSATAAKNVTLTGTSIFSDNANHGLAVFSRGAITIGNLIANSNAGGWGAQLDNRAATTALGVTLTGSNQFKFNGGGLEIFSDGAITLSNVTANGNTAVEGVYLNNTTSTVGSVVTLTGTNTFKNNAATGLEVNSQGIITLNNITALFNAVDLGATYYGVRLDNAGATMAKAVLLNGVNNISDNFQGGLYIDSTGAVTLNKLTVNDNDGAGAYVDNTWLSSSLPQNVTLIGYGNFNWRHRTDGEQLWQHHDGKRDRQQQRRRRRLRGQHVARFVPASECHPAWLWQFLRERRHRTDGEQLWQHHDGKRDRQRQRRLRGRPE
jgi:hypothetical protein